MDRIHGWWHASKINILICPCKKQPGGKISEGKKMWNSMTWPSWVKLTWNMFSLYIAARSRSSRERPTRRLRFQMLSLQNFLLPWEKAVAQTNLLKLRSWDYAYPMLNSAQSLAYIQMPFWRKCSMPFSCAQSFPSLNEDGKQKALATLIGTAEKAQNNHFKS